MLSIESMIAISSRRGGGGRQTFPVPLSKEKRIPTPVCALARNDTENFQVLSLRGRFAPVAIRAPRPQRPPCLKGAGTAKPCLGDSPTRGFAAEEFSFTPHESLHQPSVGPPPFRQGRQCFPRVQAPPGVHKYIKNLKGRNKRDEKR